MQRSRLIIVVLRVGCLIAVVAVSIRSASMSSPPAAAGAGDVALADLGQPSCEPFATSCEQNEGDGRREDDSRCRSLSSLSLRLVEHLHRPPELYEGWS